MNNNFDIQKRIFLNRARLKDKIYCHPQAFFEGNDWPGDRIGRAMLALCCHYKFTQSSLKKAKLKKQLDDIVLNLDKYLNIELYFGDVFDGFVNEQQLSGNSWFLRGLCEYYEITSNPLVLKYIVAVVENLFNKVKNAYQSYPLSNRVLGLMIGSLDEKERNGWLTSTDIGCAYIMIDGITHAYQILKDESLKLAIEELIESFVKIDYVGKKFQTHATLTCARGILRFYKITNEKKYLTYAIEIFENYQKFGMTLSYSNYNWFGCVDSWSEPCAIVDSQILAIKLFWETKNFEYVKLVNRIFFSALMPSQRSNGGAGCDCCLSDKNSILKSHIYEGFCCCTMRYAEGLKVALQENVLIEKDDITILRLQSEKIVNDELNLEINGSFQNGNQINISIKNDKPQNLYIYFPAQAKLSSNCKFVKKNCFMVFENIQNQKIKINFEIDFCKETLFDKSILFVGDEICTNKQNMKKRQKNVFLFEGKEFSKILNSVEIKKENDLKKITQQI